MSTEKSEIKIFKPREEQECVHWVTGCAGINVLAVEYLHEKGSLIEFYCEDCLKKIKKVYKH